MLGISRDSIEDNRAFAEKYSFDFPLLCDLDGEVSVQYHAIREASDTSPRRITYVVGPDGKILQTHEVRDAGAHPEDILKSL